MKVLLFGDSLLKNLSKEPLSKLEAAVPGADTYNCSTSGWNTEDALKKADYICQLKPDVVVLNYGTNDAAPWKRVLLDNYLSNIEKLIIKFSGSRIIYFLPPPLTKLGSNDLHDKRAENVDMYAQAAKELLKKKKIEYIDSQRVFGSLLKEKKEYHIDDGIHFNELGNTTLVNELTKLLTP